MFETSPVFSVEPQPVELFRSASLHKDPLAYPGQRPPSSYVTNGNFVLPLVVETSGVGLELSVHHEGDKVGLDQFLAGQQAEPSGKRIPMLAYGANMCPGSLKSKLEKVERDDAQVVPTIYGSLHGYDVVWSAGPGQNGNFIANLYRGSETVDTDVQVGINLLTPEQLLVMHATELAYDLQKITVNIEGVKMPVYFYAGTDEIYLKDGRPMAVDSIPATNRQLSAVSTRQLLADILANQDLVSQIRAEQSSFPDGQLTPDQYIEYVRGLRPHGEDRTPKGDLKARVHKVLARNGLSKLISTSGVEVASFANPSSLMTLDDWRDGNNGHNYYVLPTSVLPKERWTNSEARDKVLHGVKIHYTRQVRQNK